MKTLSHAQTRKVHNYLPDEDDIVGLIIQQQKWIRATSERETKALALLRRIQGGENPQNRSLWSAIHLLLEGKRGNES